MAATVEKELEEVKDKWQQTQQELDKTKSELHDVREELERSQSQLDEVLGELEQTHFELHQLKEKGEQQQSQSGWEVKQELAETKTKLQETEQLLEQSQSQLGETMGVLEEYQSQMEKTMGTLEESQGKLQQKHEELEQVKVELAQKQSGSDAELQKELEETKSQLRETEELLEQSHSHLGETMEVLEESYSQFERKQEELEQLKRNTQQSNLLSNEIQIQPKQRKQELSTLDRTEKDRLFKIENAIVERIQIVRGQRELLGGLIFPNYIPGVFRHRRSGQVSKPVYLDQNIPSKNIDNLKKNTSKFYSGTYIYGGFFHPHFGHTLTESIHRLWAFNNTIHKGVVFTLALAAPRNVSIAEYIPPEWFIQILEVLDIPLAKCIWVTESCIFENLLVPEPGSELTLGHKAWYSSYLEQLQQRILTLTSNLKKQDLKLFLGRSHIPLNGSVAGEKYLENMLVNEGYISLKPEDYDFIDQLAYFISAKKIIFTEGSAIYSLELINYLDAEICCLPRRSDNKLFTPHLHNKCHNYVVAGSVEDTLRLGCYNKKDGGDAISINIHPSKVIQSLREHNFATLKSWNENEFLACEREDIITYINQGYDLLKNQDPVHCLGIMEKYSQVRNQPLTGLNKQLIYPSSTSKKTMEFKHRHVRLNKLASINQSSKYLEIGVHKGLTFNAIEVQNKVAVDVNFQFNTKNYETERVFFLEVPSDEFFTSHAQDFPPFDLIYLDGLHTFEQTFRDFCASLSCAHNKTIWLIDDTCPGSYAQAQSSQQISKQLKQASGEKDGSWMGDVFKVVAAIHDFFPQFSFATFPNHGQTAVWYQWRRDFNPKWNSLEKISRLEYLDFVELKETLFKREKYFDIFERIEKNLSEL
ncbi:glycosyltransferase 61 family protein [Dapis sp. BLCC M229]|uniref:glycosyltransferase 61 family protein n=1 Tax=Dapis sp. BLCC M229 TaxID=3400188 RepID=UPI003CF63A0F